MKKRFVKTLFMLAIVLLFFMIPTVVYAHDSDDYTLDTWHDNGGSDIQFKNWFFEETSHIPETLGTQNNPLRYYFSDMGKGAESHLNLLGYVYQKNSRYLMWSNIIPVLKKGIEKWNNVYFRDGSVDRRLVYLEETTNATNANIIFYPSAAKSATDSEYEDLQYTIIQSGVYPATTERVEESCVDGWSSNPIVKYPKHCTEYDITINIREIIKSNMTHSLLLKKIEKIGTHEIGHVLGLADIESKENIVRPDLIMSNNNFDETYVLDIPYQEIVGVSIFRGLHTDGEHLWLKEFYNNQTKYKCSICNGTTTTLPSGTIIDYGHSEGESHIHTDDDLMIVGKIQYPKYGDHTHYYKKCMYCSYVSLVSDNMTYKNAMSNGHIVVCDECGIEWQQSHAFVYDSTNDDTHTSRCHICNYIGIQGMHSYVYSYLDETNHLCSCTICEFSKNHTHNYTYDSSLNVNVCEDCGYSN